MMGNDLTAAPCYCCNERRRPRGAQRMSENRAWRSDVAAGDGLNTRAAVRSCGA